MMTVMIGIDPHKRSHTASAIAPNEEGLAELTVPASERQIDDLRRWADQFPDRTWGVSLRPVPCELLWGQAGLPLGPEQQEVRSRRGFEAGHHLPGRD